MIKERKKTPRIKKGKKAIGVAEIRQRRKKVKKERLKKESKPRE